MDTGNYTTTNTTDTIRKLKACTTYNGTIMAISDTDVEGLPTEFSSTTTTPDSK